MPKYNSVRSIAFSVFVTSIVIGALYLLGVFKDDATPPILIFLLAAAACVATSYLFSSLSYNRMNVFSSKSRSKTNTMAAETAISKLRLTHAALPTLSPTERAGRRMVLEIHAAALNGIGDLLDRDAPYNKIGAFIVEAITDVSLTYGSMVESEGNPKISAKLANALIDQVRDAINRREA